MRRFRDAEAHPQTVLVRAMSGAVVWAGVLLLCCRRLWLGTGCTRLYQLVNC
jgi:hypothetical protein